MGQWGVGAVNVSSPSSGVLVENSSSGVKKKKKEPSAGEPQKRVDWPQRHNESSWFR